MTAGAPNHLGVGSPGRGRDVFVAIERDVHLVQSCGQVVRIWIELGEVSVENRRDLQADNSPVLG
ncbi:hypothetical protein [Nocardia bhagyanarayanae]|uniref:hypothetical protein n=1 Tax=Nocardia bhagyanarayanae TaxID=1215925 RepID=UPI00114DEBD3|nr:hypothetical protein [Nocardia bhagyanarayanae]